MNYSNYHTHTLYCDGADSPEELVLEAIRLGCPEIGFSGHSFLPEDTSSMSPASTHQYCAEIRKLKKKYSEQIRVLLGLELDYYSEAPQDETFDYLIGAVHYVEKDGKLLPVDESRGSFLSIVENSYHGDYYSFAEDYYRTVSMLISRTNCDVIAHFDLITKYNEGNTLFDTQHPRYIAAADSALEKLMQNNVILEINTGAMARGYRNTPYPEKRILQKWIEADRLLLLSSDCHDKSKLLFGFQDISEEVSPSNSLLQKLH